ncbi:hypothetical protein BDQ17DRAFT_1332023 [Cyathus striatus]|nr:hypothetical protein BDQ17DRAFT_1332023 [Cyathus striatus]
MCKGGEVQRAPFLPFSSLSFILAQFTSSAAFEQSSDITRSNIYLVSYWNLFLLFQISLIVRMNSQVMLNGVLSTEVNSSQENQKILVPFKALGYWLFVNKTITAKLKWTLALTWIDIHKHQSLRKKVIVKGQLLLGKVIMMYEKGARKCGKHNWVPFTNNIGTISFLGMQIWQQIQPGHWHFHRIFGLEAHLGLLQYLVAQNNSIIEMHSSVFMERDVQAETPCSECSKATYNVSES